MNPKHHVKVGHSSILAVLAPRNKNERISGAHPTVSLAKYACFGPARETLPLKEAEQLRKTPDVNPWTSHVHAHICRHEQVYTHINTHAHKAARNKDLKT